MTWDSVTWKVLEESGSELLEDSCQAACDDMYNFKVGTAGVHRYWVEMSKGGVSLSCENRLGVIGTFKFLLLSITVIEFFPKFIEVR